jgi:hypothetical protein
MPKHKPQTLQLSEIINRIDSHTDESWFDVMGIDLPGLDEAKAIDGPDDFAAQSQVEAEYIDEHECDLYEVRWPEHVVYPKFNSDACYLPTQATSEARKFMNSLPDQESNTVYSSLDEMARRYEVQESQDWDEGSSTWTFSDGSRIIMEGNDVTVRDTPSSSVAITANDENNAEVFWGEFNERFPEVAAQVRSGTAVVDKPTWDAIRQLNGFSDGPSHARDALLDVDEE